MNDNEAKQETEARMKAERFTAIAGMLCVLWGASVSATAQSAAATAAGAGTEPERWSSFLPLMAGEATSRGYELPLPFGLSAIYNFIERDIQVDDLRLGLDGGSPQSVSRFVDLGSDSRVNVALGAHRRLAAAVRERVRSFRLRGQQVHHPWHGDPP
ncbi:MAG: hypothetical protein HC834_02265 [Rhodospirillales bacterium]|nr:hypothetical protein [Rhodospirillales bacterium]